MTKNAARLRFLYTVNILGAGLSGFLITFFPNWARSNMFVTPQDASMLGILGSIWFAIGVVSALGLRFPQTFKPIFLMQIIYKSTWIMVVALPLIAQGRTDDVSMYVYMFLMIVGIFAITLFADPWFLKQSSRLKRESLSYDQ